MALVVRESIILLIGGRHDIIATSNSTDEVLFFDIKNPDDGIQTLEHKMPYSYYNWDCEEVRMESKGYGVLCVATNQQQWKPAFLKLDDESEEWPEWTLLGSLSPVSRHYFLMVFQRLLEW